MVETDVILVFLFYFLFLVSPFRPFVGNGFKFCLLSFELVFIEHSKDPIKR